MSKDFENRAYQHRTVSRVNERWNGGATRVLVVAPPGSGKTEMGMMLLGTRRVLWVVHTRELAVQALQRIQKHFQWRCL